MTGGWREWLEAQPYSADLEFAPGADEAVLADVERRLGSPLEPALRSLLSETDGIVGEYGLGVVWPAARIAADNEQMRTTPDFAELYMPFQGLLFFADGGNGDLFGFRALAGDVPPDVYVWDHEDDSRNWVARGLREYLDGWLGGTLKI
jgi:hypothetical protein